MIKWPYSSLQEYAYTILGLARSMRSHFPEVKRKSDRSAEVMQGLDDDELQLFSTKAVVTSCSQVIGLYLHIMMMMNK